MSDGDWSDHESPQQTNFNSGASNGFRGGRGGRGRGGRGRGGGGGGFNRVFNDNEDRGQGGWRGDGGGRGFNDNEDQDQGGWGRSSRGDNDFGGRGRGRGGGGRGYGGDRGGRGFGGDQDGGGYRRQEDGGEGNEKPRERYIPPEPTDDENVMFGSSVSVGINFSKYEDIKVKVTGENPVPPCSTFSSCGFRDFVLSNIKKSGYTIPTPVQKHAMPIIMAGRDLMACAQTGSGKTAAFLVPIINTLLDKPMEAIIDSEGVEPQAVILSPTRELTKQIFEEARKFSHGSILKICIAYGGTAVFHQVQTLMRGCHILVATPGRLNDFVQKGRVRFSSVRFFVLDEADRMLDMGFLPEVEKMLKHSTMCETGQRQTLMFSATFPAEIQRLAGSYLADYLFLAVGVVGGACSDVQQIFYEVSKFDKKDKLSEILKQNGNQLTLVFVEQKRNADFVAAFLSENKFPTTSIHGDRLQSQREAALADFRSGRMPTLIATGVASRGLDIKDVAHVINYDLPNSIDEYVHRIGRTGRVGNKGIATSFYDPDADSSLASELVKILTQCNQEVPAFLGSYSVGGGGDGGYRNQQSFGSRDVRRGGKGGSFSYQAPQVTTQEEEEDDSGW